MYIDHRRFERHELTEAQRKFLSGLVSFAQLIQRYTYEKSALSKTPSPSGLFTSISLAHLALLSNWGEHAVAKKANNLGLLTVSDYWSDEAVEYHGKKYRKYDSWLDFAADFSNELTFHERKTYAEVLAMSRLDDQIDLWSRIKTDCPTTSDGKIEELIERYGLWEFDLP